MTVELDGIAPLPHLGVIRVVGDDAASFLHGQLTQDFALLGMDQARLAAYCSAKGRMLASFIGWRESADAVLLVCSRDLLAATLKRLSMFVLRAKARLSDASDAYELRGLAGPTMTALAGFGGEPWSRSTLGSATLVRLYPADGQPLGLWLAPKGTDAPAGPPLDAVLWRWAEVRSGVATLSAPVVDAFVPQMLNYESVGGVNFKKGCYPGQEVVARSQFRGTLKRRAFVVHSAVEPALAQEVFHSSDAEQPCGQVVQAAPAPGGGWDAIVSLQLAATLGGSLHLGAADGPLLALQPLPYGLLADV